MANSGSQVSGVAERYANSLFELALESKSVEKIEKDLARFEALLDGSTDLQRLIRSPVFSADDQLKAISKISDKANITGIVGNFLRVVARNRRLFAVPAMIRNFRARAAQNRGEVAADVISAHDMTAEQIKTLGAALKGVAGKDVAMNITVDPSLLGGMIVKIGSRQIDTSLKTKLNSLRLALKEVG